MPPPPGVISSLRSGFDTIAAHIAAILLPLCLDLLLWLGPHLSIQRLFSEVIPDISRIWLGAGVPTADVQAVTNWYEATVPMVNLLWMLRTLPIGVSSLLFAKGIPQTPFGAASTWQVSGQMLPAWMVLLVVTGWVAGGFYFSWVARLCGGRAEPSGGRTGWAVGQSIVLSVVWAGLAAAFALPAFVLIGFLLQVSAILAQIAILAASFLSMWLIVPFFFWPHGIFLKQQNAVRSMFSSIQMARFTLPMSSFFVLSVFLLGMGLNFVWSAAPTDSWMTLVGILGHAFITTALLAASFIYYRDMTAWLDSAMERLKAKAALTKQA